jgi:HEPN domain-containing protein
MIDKGLYAAACFHTWRAAEMAQMLKRHHSIRLWDERELRWLQEHYLQARNPNARLSEYTAEDAERAVRIAAEVVQAVKAEMRR